MISSYPTVPTASYTDEMQKLRRGDRVAIYRWNTANDEFACAHPAAHYWYWEGKVEHRHRDGSLTVSFGSLYCRHRSLRFAQSLQHSSFQTGSGDKIFRLEPLTERIEKILLAQEIHAIINSFGMSGWFSLTLEELEMVGKLVQVARSRRYTDAPNFRYE